MKKFFKGAARFMGAAMGVVGLGLVFLSPLMKTPQSFYALGGGFCMIIAAFVLNYFGRK